MKKLIYPCVVRKEDDIYYANFPDFNACFTDAESIDELFANTKEVLNGVIFTMLKNKMDLPAAGENIKLEEGEFLILVESPVGVIKDRINNMAVKKTLTLPAWMNEMAMEHDINFSQVLQEGLKRELNIKKTIDT